MATFEIQTTIDAPVSRVWEALADIGAIHEWNPGVKDARVTSEEPTGPGASRRCDLGGKNYLDELVVEWEEGRRLTMRIVDTNLPFKRADVRFHLEPRDGTTTVKVSPDYELKYGPLGSVLDALFARRAYEKGMRALLAGLKRHVEADDEEAPAA